MATRGSSRRTEAVAPGSQVSGWKGRLARSGGTRRRFADPLGQRGVSLVEIMVATLILTIVALGMAEFFARGRFGFDQEEYKRVATLLAQEALERTIARPYPVIASWNEDRTIASKEYSIAVTAQSNIPEANIKTIRCAVTWDATPSVTRTTSMETMVYNK